MSNQPNEAAIYALSLLHLGTIDWLPVPGTHRLNGHAARVVLAAIRDGKVPGIVEAKSLPLIRDEMTAMQAEISSLRSALANAEKALLVIGERAVCDFDDATVGDVDRVVTDHMKYKDWLRSVMTAATERDALRSALAAAEKDRAASARDWEAALSAHDRRVEELNQALAKLAEAERDCAGYKERIHELSDELGACEKERDEALRWKNLAMEEKRARDERDSLAATHHYLRDLFKEYDCGSAPLEELGRRVLRGAQRADELAAQLAEARGLRGDLLAWLTSPKMQTWQYHENGFFAEDAQKFVNRLSLALPSDRGAEDRS